MALYVTQIDCLPEIVEAVQGRVEVYMDGGIRTGSDVLKAVALGARCVFIGRPAIWGLAYKVTVQESMLLFVYSHLVMNVINNVYQLTI